MTRILSPEAPSMQRREQQRPGLDTLAGKTVGFIDNAKPNFNHLVDDLEPLLIERHGVARVIKRRKPSPSMPAERAVIEELAAQCDAVITGSGD